MNIALAKRLLVMCVFGALAAAQSAPTTPLPPSAAQTTASAEITGTVKAGTTPLPGVTISAANTLTGQKILTSTDEKGEFKLQVPPRGRYVIRAELAAFAPATKEALINAQNPKVTVELVMELQSRVAAQQQSQASQMRQTA